MVFNKILFFSCSSPLSILSNNILGKEALVNIDNPKNQLHGQLNNCNSKKFSILQNVFRNVLFLHKFISGQFFILPEVPYTN